MTQTAGIPEVKVAKVSLHPTTKLLTYLNGVNIPLDDTGRLVLKISEPHFTRLMNREPGETFLFEWEGKFGEEIPAGITVAGVTLGGTDHPHSLHTTRGKVVGEYHLLMNTAERKVAFAHIIKPDDVATT